MLNQDVIIKRKCFLHFSNGDVNNQIMPIPPYDNGAYQKEMGLQHFDHLKGRGL